MNPSKTLFTIIIFGYCIAALLADPEDTNYPPHTGVIDLNGVGVKQVLYLYQAAAHKQLVVASDVKTLRTGITLHMQGVGPAAAVPLLEKALKEQAGVIITELDDKRVSVTYNDALILTNNQSTETN